MCINCSSVSVLQSLSVCNTKHRLLADNDVVYYAFVRGYRSFLYMVLCSKSECTAIKYLDSYSFLQLLCCHFNQKISNSARRDCSRLVVHSNYILYILLVHVG